MKLRIRSTKLGKIRFTSHRDAARMWERALRRVNLPLALSAGFTPRPKISFGLALPTGAESIAEYVDIELQPSVSAADIDLDGLPERLGNALPIGFDVLVVADRPAGSGSLQDDVTSCTWELWSPHLTEDDYRAAERLLDADVVMIDRERKGKRSNDDVRPMILGMRCADDRASRAFTSTTNTAADDRRAGPARLIVDLVTVGRALRPNELAALAFPNHDARDVRALRTHQWIDADGERLEVLALPPQLVGAVAQQVTA